MADPATITATVIAGVDFVIKQGKGIINPLKRKHGYVKNITENYDRLDAEYNKLCTRENDIKIGLERCKTEEDETGESQLWRKNVGKMKDDVEALKSKYHKRPTGSIHYFNLMKLGKRIVKKTEEVVSLWNEREKIPSPTVKKPPVLHTSIPTNKIIKFPSVEETVRKLQEYLAEENIKTVGVGGPIGVGKSTIMNRLQQEIEKPNNFVFLINVGKKGDERYIQNELLKRLKEKPEELSDEEKKQRIYEKLKNYQNYFLLLDDVFANVELEKVGINYEHKGKMVIASRYKRVFMRMDKVIEVKRLSEEDAQNMFWDRVPKELKDNPDIKREAELIIKFCSGMPYLIKLIGNYLTEMSLAEDVNRAAVWRNTRHALTSPTGEPKGDLETVYKSLKLEIDRLKTNDRSCFLYLASFSSTHELLRDNIIECWRAEQFLEDYKKLGTARDEGCRLLVSFVNNFLLEKGTKEAQYKMFEFYQRLASRFAKNNKNYIQKSRIFVMSDSSSSTLPDECNSERISTLLLKGISCLPQFPSPVYEFLRLLELHKAKIATLPSSISTLTNLKAMYLKNCDQLRVLCDEVGKLHNLEILDIRHTGIYNLPPVVGNLTTLKCLRVSIRNQVNGSAGEMIPPKVIARLRSLEELGIDANPTDGRWNQIVESIVADVATLTELTTLWFYFPMLNSFETFISQSKSWNRNHEQEDKRFRSFNIIVGQQQEDSLTEFDDSRWSDEKRLRFSAGEAFPDEILKVLEEASSFELIAHKAANLSVFRADNTARLEICTIKNCPEMTSIIDGHNAAFQRLKKLYIDDLPKLEHIWKNPVVPPNSLTSLTILKIKGCHSLRVLFSGTMVLGLKLLQQIQIEDCQVIKEIIEDGSVADSGAFPNLKELELINLPLLSNICNVATSTWNSLEMLKIDACVELKNFPSTFQKAEKLKCIYWTQSQWNQLVWPNDNDVTKNRFQNLHQPI
ncbi:disease resistance protein At4g27190-like [Mangifera indica]|uniref:disease resistance protein At4g27190-like n=1 Tax=Mangifera indica TaxID=29780 RepID=UPI001CFAE806|nr:disease resistance protein At4g27190-like [Mangifera indica]